WSDYTTGSSGGDKTGFDCAETDTTCLFGTGSRQPKEAFIGPQTLPWIMAPPYVTTLLSGESGAVVPAALPSTWATLSGVGSAGIIGWLGGGVISSLLNGPLGMDAGWLCKYNPAYRLINASG